MIELGKNRIPLPRRVLTDVSPDAVIHCAAWTAVDAAEDEANREKVHLINAVGTENIARVCKDLDSVMMYISTDYVRKVMERIRQRFSPEDCARLEEMLAIVSQELMPEVDLPGEAEQ